LEAWSGRGARLDVVVLSRLYREVARDLSLLLTENPPSEGDVLPGAPLLLLLRLRLLLCVWFLFACVCLLFARFGVRVFVRVYVCTCVRVCVRVHLCVRVRVLVCVRGVCTCQASRACTPKCGRCTKH
jgi:hypothetical protein